MLPYRKHHFPLELFEKILTFGLSFIKEFLLFSPGDFGATYAMVEYAKSLGLIAIYATTLRESKEILNKDGSITKQNIFKHCIFRKY